MTSYWHVHPIRVRYQETDQMAVVYYANYVNWFEIGRTEFIRHAGVPYRTVEAAGLLLPVTDLQVKYEQAARYDDRIAICTRLRACSPLRLQFDSQVRVVGEHDELPVTAADDEGLPGTLLAAGGTHHVWLSREWKPIRLDRAAPDIYALLHRLMNKAE